MGMIHAIISESTLNVTMLEGESTTISSLDSMFRITKFHLPRGFRYTPNPNQPGTSNENGVILFVNGAVCSDPG
jgi:hypothetical protein